MFHMLSLSQSHSDNVCDVLMHDAPDAMRPQEAPAVIPVVFSFFDTLWFSRTTMPSVRDLVTVKVSCMTSTQ